MIPEEDSHRSMLPPAKDHLESSEVGQSQVEHLDSREGTWHLDFQRCCWYSKIPSLCSCRATMRNEHKMTDSSLASGGSKSVKAPLQWLHCQMKPSLVLSMSEAVVTLQPSPAALCGCPQALCLLPSLSFPTQSISAFTPGNPIIRELRRHWYNFKETRTSSDAWDGRENLPPTQMLLSRDQHRHWGGHEL